MDERLLSILEGTTASELAEVAGAALASEGPAKLVGTPTFAEITTPHADARTIGIVLVSGMALGAPDAPAQAWSSVTKIIDLAVEGHFNSATSPENEEQVYDRGIFAGMGLKFRPARCHHISRPSEGLKVLWLEDLTGAKGAPFEVHELAQMVRHLGEWNAVLAATPPSLDFSIGRDFPVRRWDHWNFPARLGDLGDLVGNSMLREMYARQPLDVAAEFVSVFGRLVEQSKSLPHALSIGDAPIGNFFYRPEETVAVDWSGLSIDPLAADGGCLIGSALTWGRQFADIAAQERELFESYAAGLVDGGAKEDRRVMRSGYLAQMALYLGTTAIFPTMLPGPRAILSREFLEKRFGGPLEEFGGVAARVIDLLPSYIKEIRGLLA